VRAAYAKFETFPIWNLPLKHEVNVAYEAATADIRDFNQIDPFHLEAHGEQSVNYNRDVDAFPVIKRILEKIEGSESAYKSPTDMGVNRAGFGITCDAAAREAAKQEIIRRHFRYSCEYALGLVDQQTVERAKHIMTELGLKPEDRSVVAHARRAKEEGQERDKGNEGVFCGAALELADGTAITGKNSPMMHASSSLVINAIKHLAGIPDQMHLLSPAIIESVGSLKKNTFSKKALSLNLEETLIALAISATTNPAAQGAMEKLKELEGCEMHITHIPTPGDEGGLRHLGLNLTSDPVFSTTTLYTG